MDKRTYNCTPEQRAQLESYLASHGVAVDLNASGEVTQAGWDIAWSFPSPTQIMLTVKKHPFAEESILWGKLSGILGPRVEDAAG